MAIRFLGLDLSTKPGLAVADKIEDDKLPQLIKAEGFCVPVTGGFPFDAIDAAEKVADIVTEWFETYWPDRVIIEQTNRGKNRMSQKKLEFIHSAVLRRLRPYGVKIFFIDTSEWRKVLQQKLSKEDRKNNEKVSKAKKTKDFVAAKKALGVKGRITAKHLSVAWCNANYGLSLLMKDNDTADAICLVAAASNPSVAFCDGV